MRTFLRCYKLREIERARLHRLLAGELHIWECGQPSLQPRLGRLLHSSRGFEGGLRHCHSPARTGERVEALLHGEHDLLMGVVKAKVLGQQLR